MRGNKGGGGIGALKLPFKNARVFVKPGLEKLCIATLFFTRIERPAFLFFFSLLPRRSLVPDLLRNFLIRKLVLFVCSLFVVAVNRAQRRFLALFRRCLKKN